LGDSDVILFKIVNVAILEVYYDADV